MRYLLSIIILIVALSAYSQNYTHKDFDGEFYYNRTNTAANYFDKPAYEIDSVFFFKEIKLDTIIAWTTGSSRPVDKDELIELEKNDKFSAFFQKGITQHDGKTITHKMKPNYYKIINGTLFELTEIYTITQDSFLYLKEKLSMDEVIKITNSVTQKTFRPIFSTEYFKDSSIYTSKESGSSCPNIIYLDQKWETEFGKFYEFHIENRCGYWGHHWGYIVDDELKIVKYGGYYSKDYNALNEKNLIFKRETGQ